MIEAERQAAGLVADWSEQVCGTLKRVVWYFEEGDVVLCRGWCGTLKRVCGTLKGVVWYFEEGVWYFEEGGVVL